jgi:hypothetical protein
VVAPRVGVEGVLDRRTVESAREMWVGGNGSES